MCRNHLVIFSQVKPIWFCFYFLIGGGGGNTILDKSIPLGFIDHRMNLPLPGSMCVREMGEMPCTQMCRDQRTTVGDIP